MSDLQLIEQLYEAFGARDDDTFRKLCTPDIEWVQSPGFPGGKTYAGADAVIGGVFERNASLWNDFHFRVGSMHAADGHVFVLGHYTGTGRDTGKPFSAVVAHVYDIADGLVARFRMYADTHTIRSSLEPA